MAARKFLAGKGSFVGLEFESTPGVTPAPELEPDDSERRREEGLPLEVPPREGGWTGRLGKQMDRWSSRLRTRQNEEENVGSEDECQKQTISTSKDTR